MAELWPGAPAYHREVGAAAARAGVEVLVAVGPLARNYVQGARGVPVTRWAATIEQDSPRSASSCNPATASWSRAPGRWGSR